MHGSTTGGTARFTRPRWLRSRAYAAGVAAVDPPAGLVGRDREWSVLSRSVERAVAGRGGVLLLAGEPGIGKTRLLGDAVDLAARLGSATALATCVVSGRPYWPWRQLLRGHGGAALFDAERHDEGARAELFEDVDDHLGALTACSGLVVGIDDLQWADIPSLRLLALMGRSTPVRPFLVLGAFRDVEVGDDHPLTAVLGELGAAVSVLAIGGLSGASVSALLEEEGADSRLGPAVHSRTGGNPFFVREVAHLIADEPAAMDEVPAAVSELVRHRIAASEPSGNRLLEVAAVAWTASDLALLGRALAIPAADLIGPAEDLCRARLLERTGAGYRFRHDLVRDAVLGTMPPARREELSWKLGSVLWQGDDATRLEEAASLLQTGAAAGDPAVAVRAALRASTAAMASLAPEVAAAHLAWVLDQPVLPAEVDQVEVLLALGEARRDGGDWDAGGDAFERAARFAVATGRPDQLTRAALGFGAGLSGFEVRVRDQRQIDLLLQAADALDGTDSVEAAYVLARLSVAVYSSAASGRREGYARRALEMAERVGDPGALGHALAAWCDVISGPDHVDERLAAADRIIATGRGSGNTELELLGRRFRVVALLERGDLAGFDREVLAFAALAERSRLLVRWYVPLWHGLRALLAGRVDQAAEQAQQVLEIAGRADSTNGLILAYSLRLAMLDQAGVAMPADADKQLAAYVGGLDPEALSGQERALLLGLALLDDDKDEMRRHLDTLVAQGFGERDAEYLGTLTTCARACIYLGDVAAGALVASRLEPYVDLWVVDGIGAALLGSVEEMAAALDLLCARPGAAGRQAATVELYDRLPAPLLARRARLWPELIAAALGRPAPAPIPSTGASEVGVLRREGKTWLAVWAGHEARVADGKGVRDCAALLARPGRELHVLELAGGGGASGAQAVLDDTAVDAYRARIIDLQADVEEAEAANDLGRASRAGAELEIVLAELQRSLGIGGRSRPMRDEHERARQAIRARIRYAIGRIAAEHPALGRHLEASIRTGTFCSYRPERPVVWQIHT